MWNNYCSVAFMGVTMLSSAGENFESDMAVNFSDGLPAAVAM